MRRYRWSFVGISLLLFLLNLCWVSYGERRRHQSSRMVKRFTRREDVQFDVKVIPEDKEVSSFIKKGEQKRFFYPVENAGHFRLIVTPCSAAIFLKFSVRQEVPPPDVFYAHSYLDDPDLSLMPYNSSKKPDLGSQRKQNFRIADSLHQKSFAYYHVESPLFKGEHERLLAIWAGYDPWIFKDESADPGLYVLKVTAANDSYIHLFASTSSADFSEDNRIISSSNSDDAITIKWKQRSTNKKGTYCIVLSEKKKYLSLCQARELMKRASYDSAMLVGCTVGTTYTLPTPPRSEYHLAVWNPGELRPMAMGVVKAKKLQKIPVLRPGKLVNLKLIAGVEASARFEPRRKRRRLHISAVSCTGGLRLLVTAEGRRVAQAKGKETIHLVIKGIPKKSLLFTVSPSPPSTSSYHVLLSAAYKLKKLPLPRLPRDVNIYAEPTNCTTVIVHWAKAPGSVNYCVLLKTNPSNRPRALRPPLQCGWEQVLRNPSGYEVVWCGPPIAQHKQAKEVLHLHPNTSYIANVLVLHPLTNRTLSLMPVPVKTPSCLDYDLQKEYELQRLAYKMS